MCHLQKSGKWFCYFILGHHYLQKEVCDIQEVRNNFDKDFLEVC